MAMRCLDNAVLISNTGVIAAGGQPVMGAKRLVARGDVECIAPFAVAAGGREPIGTQHTRCDTKDSQGILEAH